MSLGPTVALLSLAHWPSVCPMALLSLFPLPLITQTSNVPPGPTVPSPTALLSLALLSLALLSLFTLTSYVPHGPTVLGPTVPIHPN